MFDDAPYHLTEFDFITIFDAERKRWTLEYKHDSRAQIEKCHLFTYTEYIIYVTLSTTKKKTTLPG